MDNSLLTFPKKQAILQIFMTAKSIPPFFFYVLFLTILGLLPVAEAQENVSEKPTIAGDSPPLDNIEEESGPSVEIQEAVFVGSRRQDRSVAESPVPVDIINQEDLAQQGYTDMHSMLSTVIPSYNVNSQPASDAATLVRPAKLRGLSADSTLVLLNGKRRYRSAAISFWSADAVDGSQGPDIAAIPYIALKRVEVLRDGASAQYGSDAIAGVLNFVLKDDDQGGTVETRWGQHYEGDGASWTVAANAGMPLMRQGEQNGFANFSVEYTEAQSTDRSVQRDDAQSLIDAYQRLIEDSTQSTDDRIYYREARDAIKNPAQVWGAPEIDYDFKFIGNMGLDLGDSAQLYFVPSFAKREIRTGYYFRHPTSGSSVFGGPVINGTPTVKVANLSPSSDITLRDLGILLNEENGWLGLPITTNGVPDLNALKAVSDDPNFHAFNNDPRLLGGFTPQFNGVVTDMGIASGLRGELENEWRYDASAIIGQNKTEFFVDNTINPQLAAHPDFSGNPNSIPTSYSSGAFVETDYILNLDFSRPFETGFFHSPLNLATGLEYRVEEFEIEAGDEYSWWSDRRKGGLLDQGFYSGANGYPGFPNDVASIADRGSYAAYIDLEADVVENWLAGFALRYEDYEDFGDTFNFKLASRWQTMDNLALRGSVSKGFRAPTVGQMNVRAQNAGFFDSDGDGVAELFNTRTLPPTNPDAAALGAQPLKPETSVNLSFGTVLNLNKLNVTLDYYHIKMEDRMTFLSPILTDDGDAIRYFSNGIDTTTQGIDIVASYPIEYGGGLTTLTIAANWNQTEVDKYAPNVKKEELSNETFIDQKNKLTDQLEKNYPDIRFTLGANHVQGPWRFLTRLRFYDDFSEYHAQYYPISSGARWLVDAEAEYLFDSGISLAAGVQNLFDTYPRKNSVANELGAAYPESSPYGFGGGFYYLKAAYTF